MSTLIKQLLKWQFVLSYRMDNIVIVLYIAMRFSCGCLLLQVVFMTSSAMLCHFVYFAQHVRVYSVMGRQSVNMAAYYLIKMGNGKYSFT